jgi:hypothetical protein
MKSSSLRKLLKKEGQDGLVKLSPRLASNGRGSVKVDEDVAAAGDEEEEVAEAWAVEEEAALRPEAPLDCGVDEAFDTPVVAGAEASVVVVEAEGSPFPRATMAPRR